MSELADETDSKSVIRKGVWVRVPPPAVREIVKNLDFIRFFAIFLFSKTVKRDYSLEEKNLTDIRKTTD